MNWRITGSGLCAVVAAALALALAPAMALADVEPNDGIEQAEGPLAGGTNHDGEVSTDNDDDWYFFYLGARAQMQFVLTHLGGDCSARLNLRSDDGRLIDGIVAGPDKPATLNRTLDPGRYVLVAFASSGCAGTKYRFRIDPPEAIGEGPPPAPAIATGEPNDTREQAFGPLGHGQPYAGTIETDNDVDWFTFYTGAPGPVDIAVTNTGECRVGASVYDDSPDSFDSTSVSPDFTNRVQFSASQANQYFVAMTGDCVGATYRLSVTGVISASPPPRSTCGTPGAPGYLYPAKMRVGRSQVLSGERKLDVFAPITSRAEGEVQVTYQGDGRLDSFNAPVTENNAELDQIRFRQSITRGQARLGTGIVTIYYKGDVDTRPEEVRLRAASRSASLGVDEMSLIGDRLSARGGVTSLARGVVRFRFSYLDAAGVPQVHLARATIQGNGDWELLDNVVPPQLAQCGGYLSILFTGYFERRIRGEMLAYQLLPDQVRQP